jgi:hypothetical protein
MTPYLRSQASDDTNDIDLLHESRWPPYAAFAQSLGICTQSSVFLILDESALPLQWHPDKIPYNVGL